MVISREEYSTEQWRPTYGFSRMVAYNSNSNTYGHTVITATGTSLTIIIVTLSDVIVITVG